MLQSRAQSPPDVVNLTYWYSPKAIKQLTRITASVHDLNPSKFRSLCEVAISACARKASFADPHVSVPVKLRAERYTTQPGSFENQGTPEKTEGYQRVRAVLFSTAQYATQIESLWPVRSKMGTVVSFYENSLGGGATSLAAHPAHSADLIITSPPYLGAQKYVRATSLALGWLSLAPSDGLRQLELRSIGREHFHKLDYREFCPCGIPEVDNLLKVVFQANPLRAHIAARYLLEMREALSTCHRILKPGGQMVLVRGANALCGRLFDTTAYLKRICADLQFSLLLELTDIIKSRGLMTRRNRTAGLIPMESVILLQK